MGFVWNMLKKRVYLDFASPEGTELLYLRFVICRGTRVDKTLVVHRVEDETNRGFLFH